MTDRADRVRRSFAFGAALAGAVDDVVYLRLIADQGTGRSARVEFFATFVAVMTGLAVIGWVSIGRRKELADAALLAAASGFVAAGFIGLWSIGLLLIVAAVMAAMAISWTGLPRAVVAAARATPILALAAGLLAT